MEILTSKFDEQLREVRRFAKERKISTPGINKLSKWLKQHYPDYLQEVGTDISFDNRGYYFVMNEVYNDINKKIENVENNRATIINLNYCFIRLNIALKQIFQKR